MKKCNKCGEIKPFECFGKHRIHKDGLQSFCKECKRIIDKEYREKNREKVLERKKKYREENKEKVYWQKRNAYLKNRDHYLEKMKVYQKENRQKLSQQSKQYIRTRYQNDSNFRLRMLLRHRIWFAAKNDKCDKTFELIGCSLEALKIHLQKTAIDNRYECFDINSYRGADFHIDHIIPCSQFDLTNEEEQRRCFHRSNLQILSAQENLKKNDRSIKKE